MSTAVAHVHGHNEASYLGSAKGWRSWAFTLDHKRIGVMYLVAILASFLLGGVMALLIRLELLTPGTYIADIYLHKRDWWYTINLVDTITIEQETHCVAFFRDPITGQDDLIIWLTE